MSHIIERRQEERDRRRAEIVDAAEALYSELEWDAVTMDQLRELDVTVLHLLILEHILGLAREQQVNGNTIRYCQDEEAALQSLEKEDFQAAFILNPPRAEEILTIASGGEKMPQKTTYFYPKLFSGLIVNKVDPDEEIEDPAKE